MLLSDNVLFLCVGLTELVSVLGDAVIALLHLIIDSFALAIQLLNVVVYCSNFLGEFLRVIFVFFLFSFSSGFLSLIIF